MLKIHNFASTPRLPNSENVEKCCIKRFTKANIMAATNLKTLPD